MEPSKEAIAVRITRLNRQILGKVTGGSSKLKRTIDREALLDALTILYDECNEDPVKKCDDLVKAFVDKYRSTVAELRRTRVCLSDFEIIETIGRGHFGEVHMVREKHTSDVYALKTMRKEQARKRATSAAEDERDVLAIAAGPWVPRLHYAFQDTNNLYLVMELCNGGDLAGLLARRNHPLSERDAAFYVAEVAHALKALHGMGFVHRDVKPHNILLDRCGHVKLGDFGSCARLSEGTSGGGTAAAVGTPDYVAPELLAAAHCAARHTVCLQYCRGIEATAISACDYWSLGVVAFELVTLKRPFSTGDDDSIAQILGNIQKYESDPESSPPFEPLPQGPSSEWRALVGGLLRVKPSRRYNYLDTLQHAALAHLHSHSIRDQAPPWVPCIRGAEDASHFHPPPREAPPPSAAPFRARAPFAGQLPFVGYTYVAPEESEDSTGGFSTSHDCTAIDLATFKSAEKLAAMRGREISSLQSKLAAAEAAASVEAEKTRRAADAEFERQRARLQAEITALSLQNRRLERQVEVEKEERMALERTNQQLSTNIAERNSAELRAAQANAAELSAERDALKEDLRRLEAKVAELQAECGRAVASADAARAQQKHYKDIIAHVQELRHRTLTEINVRPLDTIAKERALRRQTLSGGEAESREAGARIAQAEANVARETRAREEAEKRLATVQAENSTLQAELDEAKRMLARTQESLGEKRRVADTTSEQVKELQVQLAQERLRGSSLLAQVKELERGIEEASRREVALEEQYSRTESRLNERLEAAEARAASALQDDARHREKVNTLEQLVRQLEREVSALETRTCTVCEAHRGEDASAIKRDAQSDTESVGDSSQAASGQISLLKEQLERAESQLQARSEEIATLRQEIRAANLARWRKERECNELTVEAKAAARDLKRLEERVSTAAEARKIAEQKASALQSELTTLKPQYEQANKELERVKQRLEKLQKEHETAQAEVDRSRNDIRKLKSELQYSERRRLHAEEQEELSSRERAHMRDELTELRAHNSDLVQNNKALQEACSLLEEQLNDLERLSDLHEVKNKDLQAETQRMRSELEACRSRLCEAEQQAMERGAAANLASQQHDDARDKLRHSDCQLQLLRERLENRESRVAELESRIASLEGELSAAEAALNSAMRRVRELQEECSSLRTRAHEYHAQAMQVQASLNDAQEEIAAVREASEAAAAWWRTRETKADATLRQQAKLIDFLQAKVEEAGRKKCSLSHKLFGRSGRRTATSPPLRRTNRELREEVERLRAQLASFSHNGSGDKTRKPERSPPEKEDNKLQMVWSDGTRERLRARCEDGLLVLSRGDKETRARLLSIEANNVPQNEANRAFTIKLENSDKSSLVTVVCASAADRAHWVSRLAPPSPAGYTPARLHNFASPPDAALFVADNAIAIGCPDGLHSLRGPVHLEFDADVSPPRQSTAIVHMAAAGGRALFVVGGCLAHGGLLAVGSALRRAGYLNPSISMSKVRLPELTAPHLVKGMVDGSSDESSAVVACGRRVFLLRFDAATAEFKIMRSFTVDRPPKTLLLTPAKLYIAGEKPLKINLPSGPLETLGMDDLTISAAAKKHSPPKALLLVRENPIEILICYAECGVFVDENGKRTRNDDPKWSLAVQGWEFVNPFLYLIGDNKITIIHINEDAYKAPPCTCDTTSIASTASETYMPDVYNLKIKEPCLLGTAPNGIIIRSKGDSGYIVSVVKGIDAFRSIGTSVESLETASNVKGSLSDVPETVASSPQNESRESVELTTGFLADIRKRAREFRKKNYKERSPEDVIKEILTTEVGLKRESRTGRKSPALISDCDSESETEQEQNGTDSTKGTADLCATMFARQVRFQ